MMTGKNLLRPRVLLMVVLLLLIGGTLAYGWAVESFYHVGNPLWLNPGETRDLEDAVSLQNFTGDDDVSVLAAITLGNQIASLIDAGPQGSVVYTVPVQTEIPVPIHIEIPDAGYPPQYLVRVSFTEVGGTGVDLTLPVRINPTPPVAVDDSYSVVPGGVLEVVPPGVLANDYDAGGDVLSLSVVSGTSHGTLDISEQYGSFTYSPDPGFVGTDTFTYKAADALTTSNDAATVTITVGTPNEEPEVDAGGPYSVDEGGAVQVTASGSDPDGDELSYAWDLDDDGTFETPGQTVTFSAAELDGPSTHTIAVQVTDPGGLAATDEATVNVANVAPTVGDIAGPAEPAMVGSVVAVSAEFADPGVPDTHTAVWDWGDGTTSAGTVDEAEGSGSVAGSHSYGVPGLYVVGLTVTDDDGASDEAVFRYVVVYDPAGGFVTGGGWIGSPAGAYTGDPSLVGKVTFGFAAKYRKGASVPVGQTQFQFKVASLNFHSDSYDWLVVAGARACFKGEGTDNGEAGYGFMLVAIDGQQPGGGGADKFRIKIWDMAGEGVIYDNQIGAEDNGSSATVLGGGSIVIHKGN